jgi:hypothetical protein
MKLAAINVLYIHFSAFHVIDVLYTPFDVVLAYGIEIGGDM